MIIFQVSYRTNGPLVYDIDGCGICALWDMCIGVEIRPYNQWTLGVVFFSKSGEKFPFSAENTCQQFNTLFNSSSSVSNVVKLSL